MEYRLHQWIATQDLHQTTDQLVRNNQEWLQSLTDLDVIEVLMTGFIPDTYEDNREEEKIFTKLMEVLVAEVLSRIGFQSTIVKTKSESEDARITIENQTVLVDAKTFRLGRSQIAPNVKDFIKLHTVEGWIKNYNQTHKSVAIGSLVVYPSTHEWVRYSQVYKECSNTRTPVVMLSYEVLAFLLQYKYSFKAENLLSLWNYKEHFPQVVNTRIAYWNTMYAALSGVTGVPLEEMMEELKVLQLYYEESVAEARLHLMSIIDKISDQVPQRISHMSNKEKQNLLEQILIESEVNKLESSIANILKNRKGFLPIDEPYEIEIKTA